MNNADRLKRIEGQVRGIARMIDKDQPCIDVFTQISAINSGLQAVALNLLDEHLTVLDDAKRAELAAAIGRLIRSK